MYRKMKNIKTGKSVIVVEFLMMKGNCYEYYVTNKNYDNGDVVEIVAYGDDVELGIVSLSEIKADIAYCTKNLRQLMPIPGWKWV